MTTTDVLTLGDLAIRAAERYGDRTGLVFPGVRYSFAEIAREATQFARGLLSLGLKPGDRVGLWMSNSPEVLFAMLGTAMAGGTFVPFNNRLRRSEIGPLVEHADVSVLVANDHGSVNLDLPQILLDSIPELAAAETDRPLRLSGWPMLRHAVLYGANKRRGFLSSEEFRRGGEDTSERDMCARRDIVQAADTAVLMYTSGTTASPKGCLISHRALVRAGTGFAERIGMTPEDVLWCPMPMFHVSAINPFNHCLTAGATFVSLPHPDPDMGIEQIIDEQATILWPTFEPVTQSIFFHPRFARDALATARMCVHLGPPEQRAEFEAILPGCKQVAGYGLTEACGTLCLASPDEPYDVRIAGAGSVTPGMEIRLIDPETGVDVSPGNDGELWFRGFSAFDGYYKDPELTEATVDKDGWVRTGDILQERADGRYLYRGRIKDMIKVGGENVGAAEIESFLLRHPAVAMAQVVAAPDERLGQVPVAFVQLRAGARVDPEDLIDSCRGEIAGFKVPRRVLFIDEWPMSGTKIQKARLREMLAEHAGPYS